MMFCCLSLQADGLRPHTHAYRNHAFQSAARSTDIRERGAHQPLGVGVWGHPGEVALPPRVCVRRGRLQIIVTVKNGTRDGLSLRSSQNNKPPPACVLNRQERCSTSGKDEPPRAPATVTTSARTQHVRRRGLFPQATSKTRQSHLQFCLQKRHSWGTQMARSVGGSVGRTVSRSDGRSVGQTVGRWVGQPVGRSVGRSDSRTVGRWVGWLVGQSVSGSSV